MSDEIMIRDIQAGVEMAWHGKTKVVETVTKEIAFPFEYVREQLFITNPKTKKKVPFGTETGFMASDDGLPCGKAMAQSYAALSNDEFWEICNDALNGTGAIIESAGTMMDRSRRFMTIKLADDTKIIGEREFKNRISMIDSIDGSTYFHAVNTSICVVCANTARMVIGDMTGEFRFKIKHTSGMRGKIEKMEQEIEKMLGVQAEFNRALEIANNEALTVEPARDLFAGWLGIGADSLSTRTVNTAERLTELFQHGKGNKGQTLLDGISAVTDFYSHESSGGEEKEGFRWKQSISSELGSGAKRKTEFLSAIFLTEKGKIRGIDKVAIKEMKGNGNRLLKQYAKDHPDKKKEFAK